MIRPNRGELTEIVRVRFPPNLVEAIDMAARDRDERRSDTVRRFVLAGLLAAGLADKKQEVNHGK